MQNAQKDVTWYDTSMTGCADLSTLFTCQGSYLELEKENAKMIKGKLGVKAYCISLMSCSLNITTITTLICLK